MGAPASDEPRAGLVLASASPQRRAILAQLGLEFEVVAPEVEERSDGPAGEIAVHNAALKAAAVDGELVIAADTVVALDGRVYGKPRDEAEAERFLRALAGRAHDVVSGVAVRRGGGAVATAAAWTVVRFRALDEALLDWYLATGEWRGRAGGYAIQGRGAALVDGIEGDYLNVVGLPLAALLELVPDLPLRPRP